MWDEWVKFMWENKKNMWGEDEVKRGGERSKMSVNVGVRDTFVTVGGRDEHKNYKNK